MHIEKPIIKEDILPTRRFFRKFASFALLVFVVTSLSQSSIYLGSDFGTENLASAQYYDESYLMDQDGYMQKSIPQTAETDRSGMNDKLYYKVKTGDSIANIAQKFRVKVSTIVWENGLSNPDNIRPGQELVIPPVDGVTHKVETGESIAKISEKYSVDSNLIASFNQIDEGVSIKEGQSLYIPGGKKIIPETTERIIAYQPQNDSVVASSGSSSGSASVTPGGRGSVPATSSVMEIGGGTDTSSAPAGDKPFIKPTNGSLTQGYRAGHYAVDLANRSRPDVYAAAAGTVTKSVCSSGGYGCHIVIDHGSSLQTLYAHCGKLYVGVGDSISQGEAICQMGNTGRVYGATGIHLHFEVIQNGVKQNPLGYY